MAAAEQIPKSVEIYLNDHLAGSRAALDLMADILEGSKDEAFVAFMRQLRAEVERDRQQLEAIMSRLGVTQQRLKQTLASIAESMSRVKLARVGAPEGLSKLLELEALSAGIWGKRLLWHSLAAAEGLTHALADVDFDALGARAEQQLETLEQHRRTAARDVLSA
jgi:hypothetical protein